MVHVCPDESFLLFKAWVAILVASKRDHWVVIVVHPFCEMVGKFVSSCVGARVLEINDNKLLMLVGRYEEGRLFIIGSDPKNITILSLENS
jgi:hypothetical protein